MIIIKDISIYRNTNLETCFIKMETQNYIISVSISLLGVLDNDTDKLCISL